MKPCIKLCLEISFLIKISLKISEPNIQKSMCSEHAHELVSVMVIENRIGEIMFFLVKFCVY